jgi:hypothetical protein
MCEARFALSSIAKPGAISPTPASRQGRSLPLVGGDAHRTKNVSGVNDRGVVVLWFLTRVKIDHGTCRLLRGRSRQWPLAHHVEPRPLFVAQRSVEVLEVGTNCLDSLSNGS